MTAYFLAQPVYLPIWTGSAFER